MELLIKMISRRYEMRKQVIGEDPDLEKSGRVLNRIIAWNRDGIIIEADQRHVREILKGLELERANQSETPCATMRKDEGKGEHQRDDVDNGDVTNRPQMADYDDNDATQSKTYRCRVRVEECLRITPQGAERLDQVINEQRKKRSDKTTAATSAPP